MGPVEKALRDGLAVYKEKGGAVGAFWVRGRCCALGALDATPLSTLVVLWEAVESLTGLQESPSYFNDNIIAKHGPEAGTRAVRNLYRRAIRLAMERGL